MAHKFQGTKGVLIDLPGTVCDRFDDRLIEGASEAVDVLNNSPSHNHHASTTSKRSKPSTTYISRKTAKLKPTTLCE